MKRYLYGVLALSLGGGAAYGHAWWSARHPVESTDDAYVGGDITVLAPHIAGFVDAVLVQDNERVAAGQLLVRLDDRDIKARIVRAEATVKAREAAVENLEASRRVQPPLIAQAAAEVSSANAEVDRARSDVDRYRALIADRSAPQQRAEQAEADFKKAGAATERAKAQLDASQRQVHVIDAQRDGAKAALAQARAELDLARLDLEYAQLRAPIDGVVGNRSARKGAYATVGTPLLSIVPAHGLYVDANFKESQLERMRPGQRVEVVADVLPHERFVGHVTSLSPATGSEFSVLPAQNATGNFTKIVQRVPVRIALDGDAAELGKLRPGLSVTADVSLESEPPARAER